MILCSAKINLFIIAADRGHSCYPDISVVNDMRQSGLITAERLDGINSASAPGREPDGEKCDGDQDNRYDYEYRRIVGLDTE